MSNVIKVGDTVKHDFDGTVGTVLAIEDRPDNYDYYVEWVVDFNVKRKMWMRKEVLVKQS